MDGIAFAADGVPPTFQSPAPPPDAMDIPSRVIELRTPSRIMPRTSQSSCDPGGNVDLCQKPVTTSSMSLPIALGVVIPLVGALGLLILMHRRNLAKQRREDSMDPHKSLDFGLGDVPGATKRARKSILGLEKSGSRKHQLSMDMNLSSPYLLPPGLQQSRESLHSLARTIHQNEDPYRHVQHFPGSDTASMRSFQRGPDGASIYTKESGGLNSTMGPLSGPPSPLPRSYQTSLPVSPPPAVTRDTSPPADPIIAEPQSAEIVSASHASLDPFRESLPYPPGDSGPSQGHATMHSIQQPAAVARSDSRMSRGESLRSARESLASLPMHTIPEPHAIGHAMSDDHERPYSLDRDFIPEAEPAPLGLGVLQRPVDPFSNQAATLAIQAIPSSPEVQHASVPPMIAPVIEEPAEFYDDYYDTRHESQDQFEYEDRGRAAHRASSHYFNDDSHPALGVPEHEAKRLSVGLRPLPPDEFIETEDPETRANRIRSFYKEYFDDSKPEPPVPQVPAQYANPHGGYYEDYDQQYLGEAPAYFDPESNAFVMPYAQPVARRAMTPPPSGSRFPGGRPPRAMHGSLGGMSMSGGLRGPPRPGSSVSNRFGSRAASAMSGRSGPGPRKPMPPPAALTTLPTPAMLKDDNFALLNPIDFAPPETFKDQAAGRAQSPMGERRPYLLPVPVSSPLVSSYDEMAALPSPHLLRKSGTYTALDFAPPRKFKDGDTMSDAGSIRSNRSGISANQSAAIRAGAGRVSRLPGDQVFTQQALGDQLRPQWGMRN